MGEEMKLPLFHEVYETYNEDANSIDREVTHALRPLIEKYSENYKMNELESIFLCSVNLEFAQQRLERNISLKRKEREKTNSGT